MAQIKISNVIPDEESLLTQKTVQIGQNIPSIKTPFKILDFNYAPQGSNLKNTELIHINDNSLLEKSRSLNQTTFENAINDVDLVYLRESYENFRNVPFLKDKIIINTITFNFNPYTLKNATDKLDTFLDIYYGKSDFLFIPNIKAFTYENKNRKSIISKEEYVKYLSEAYNNLKFRNNKPIFIPISLKMGPNSFKSILTTLLDEGHRFFWLDFEGAGSLKYSPQIRGFHKIIDKMGLIDNVLLYATNIRREINPHATDEFCGASDILSSPLGVDIIGVNKSPQAGGGRPLPIHLQIEHKARFFDKTSYNYVKYLNFSKKKIFIRNII